MYFSAKEFYEAVVAGRAYVMKPASDGWYRRNIDSNVQAARRRYPNEVELINGAAVTFKEAKAFLAKAKRTIINREYLNHNDVGIGNVYKWLRPWNVVPKLKNFAPSDGDFGVGVEVEMGFVSTGAAVEICNDCKNWKYVTADHEGGAYPIEMTFPPMLYSKISNKSQVMRYMDLLTQKRHLVMEHHENQMVGTHVNVSVSAELASRTSRATTGQRNRRLIDILMNHLSAAQHNKYFGRHPYGYVYNQGTFWECKLFNSTTDKAAVKRYINIAVGLVKLMYDTEIEITLDNVVARLEKGYNKKGFNKFV
ncbi:hypothetical protein [Xanthomonas phage DES1]|nr:hypothetical protein [Xanthomonas phage DES1]